MDNDELIRLRAIHKAVTALKEAEKEIDYAIVALNKEIERDVEGKHGIR